MKFIAKDDALFEQLTTSIHIISSSIQRFNIFNDGQNGLAVEVDFRLLYTPKHFLRLRFLAVKEYSFYWNSEYNFYNVETYKLVKKGELFYISFDPEDEASPKISENDQDSILFSGFEGYYIDSVANDQSTSV
jgi:hypothetical protein